MVPNLKHGEAGDAETAAKHAPVRHSAMTARKAAAFLGMPVSSLYHKLYRGALRGRQRKGLWRIPYAEVLAYKRRRKEAL